MTLDFCQLRDRCGLGLAEVAAEFGEPLDSVCRWENGQSTPPDRVLRSLAIMADFSGTRPELVNNFAKGVASSSNAGAKLLSKSATPRGRKAQLGQFFTPPRIANFMASLFAVGNAGTIKLLDAGAGQGALTEAFMERRHDLPGKRALSVEAFEYDEEVIPILRGNLADVCARVGADWKLVASDFIETAAIWICLGKGSRFTHAILNPPYKKIGNGSNHRALLRSAGLETVNLYAGFIGMALELLEPGGELVAIVPRSFCNGPYYQPFRKFVLRRASIQHVHMFDARNKAFKDDSVLQENVIVKLVRGGEQRQVTISTSRDDAFSDYAEKRHAFARIVFPDDAGQFIHIPTGDDEQVLERANFSHSLSDLGLAVSTGPVVDFRLKAELRDQPESGTVPLLYPGHFDENGLRWPKAGFKKPNAIRDTPETRKWLYPSGFYAVVRRFSSKEERRRIVASVVDPALIPEGHVGFENHLNVFHAKRQPISEDMARGLSVYLNCTAVDAYFRRFNGHTQVNATDLRAMRYPSKDELASLGKWAKQHGRVSQDQIDDQVGRN
jgi:adenine-specific DNA-methyltransferase